MAIIRGAIPADDYAIVSNHWFRDPRLSGKAKGYMGYIATHSPLYRLTVDQLIAEMKDGKDAVYAGLKELVTLGYLVRTQGTAERGTFAEVDYQFGPAALVVKFDRAWPPKPSGNDKPPVQTASGKPRSGHDQGKCAPTSQTASGFSASGKPASGKPDSKKYQGLKDQEKKYQSPLPPAEQAVPRPPVVEPETGGEFSNSDQHPERVLSALVRSLTAAAGWDATTTRAVLVELQGRGIGWAEIARVAADVAAGVHGPTGSPRRMLSWWPSVAVDALKPAGPRWAQGPTKYLPTGTLMCRLHRGQPASSCGNCAGARAGVDVIPEDSGPVLSAREAVALARAHAQRAAGRHPAAAMPVPAVAAGRVMSQAALDEAVSELVRV